jgi:3-hydroxyisobutyrate dehydrogenase-like beta-hydroxyacid dehydrogenase
MRISVLGTGLMGSAIANGLLAAGHEVTVFNRTAAKVAPLAARGAAVAESAAEAIAASACSIVVLFDGAGTRELLLSDTTRPALKGASLLSVAATSPDEIVELANDVADAGGNLAEVNVTVYPDQVTDRTGHFIVASDSDHAELWTHVLSELGPKVHHVGAVGNASKAELALWLSYMFQTVSVAYSVAAFAKLSLPMEVALSTLTENPTLTITGAEHLVPQMARRKYTSEMWSVDNFAASTSMIIDFAKGLGLPTRLFEEIHDIYTSASSLGHGHEDVAAIFETFMEDAVEADQRVPPQGIRSL